MMHALNVVKGGQISWPLCEILVLWDGVMSCDWNYHIVLAPQLPSYLPAHLCYDRISDEFLNYMN